MPVVSVFFGIYIRMYFNEHPPPHFMAEYQGHTANVAIESGEIIDGNLPKRAVRMVKEWALEHQQELMDNWNRARELQPLQRIPGADYD